MRRLVFLFLLSAVACKRTTPTPADFARSWATLDAEQNPDARARAADAFTTQWQDKHYTWEGLALATLCVDATRTCAMSFWNDVVGEPRHRIGGLYPRVHFTDTAFGDLKTRCKGQDRCVVTIDGVMSRVSAGAEVPLTVDITEAHVVQTRAPSGADTWFAAAAAPAESPRPIQAKDDDATHALAAHAVATKVF